MKVSIEKKNYYGNAEDYLVLVEDIAQEKAKEIVNLIVFPTPAPTPSISTYVDIKTWHGSKVTGYFKALRAFAESTEFGSNNKIEQIKFLRSISDLSLRDAKDFVEYVLHNGNRPVGMAAAL